MPTALPPSTDYTGAAVTQGGKKTFVAAMRLYLSDLLGATGAAVDARAALGAAKTPGVRTITAAGPTVLTSADEGLIIIDATSNAVSVTLPSVSSYAGLPMSFCFIRSDSSTNAVTVSRAGADTFVGGATGFVLVGQKDQRTILGDGVSKWASVVKNETRTLNVVSDFGAYGNGVADDTAAFQAALDFGGVVFVPDGTYKITTTLLYKTSSSKLIGAGRENVVINYTATTGPVVKSNVQASASLLWCELSKMKIVASAMTSAKTIVDWKSMQFGLLDELWLFGPSSAGSVGLNINAVWAVTEGTYNTIRQIYVGGVEQGISIGDGGNSNQIIGGRIQPNVSGGYAIQAAGTVAGRVSNLSIFGLGMEYPGAISNGITLTNVDGATILGCRFEGLNLGVNVDSTSKNVHVPYRGNYFEGVTTPILAGAAQVEPSIFASVSFDGTTGTATGTARGCTVTRTGVGAYTITLLKTMRNTEYSVQVTASSDLQILTSKATGSFTFATQTIAKAAIDAATVDVTVSGVA